MSSLTLSWDVKCMPCQPSHSTQLKAIKNTLKNGWHVLKIYKHMFNYESSQMNKSQPNLGYVT
jgi:hypothetical protein